MEIFIETLTEYMFNNQLVIDKGTYLSIVIGQITIYAILLTFYQFIVSYQGTSKKSVLRYLGFNLVEYYIYKRLKRYNRVISKRIFGFFFILEILYKPLLVIFGELVTKGMVRFLNFWWYVYVISFYVMFTLLFIECARCTLVIKMVVDKRDNERIIRQINKDFRKKTIVQRWKRKNIELLMDDMEYIRNAVEEHEDGELNTEYTKLIIDVWEEYEKIKEKEINLIETKGYKTRNQVAWIQNMDSECWLLNELINEKYIEMNSMLERYIVGLQFRLLKLNLRRAQIDNYKEISLVCQGTKWEVVDCEGWRRLQEDTFEKCSCDNKLRVIDKLFEGGDSNNTFYIQYCVNLMKLIMRESIRKVFREEMQPNEFVNIFECIRYDDNLNDYYAKEICENLILYNKISVVELIKLLSKENCTYVFAYLIIYYSIYKFRFKWEYVNISMLRALIENGEKLESQYQRIDNMISNSCIGHRYYSDIFIKLIENRKKDITDKWLEEIYQQEYIDAFYITIIKICVLGQEYKAFFEEGKIDAKFVFINELVKHDEILACKNIRRMIAELQFNEFKKIENWPSKLNITLRTLLLLDIDIPGTMINDEIRYRYYKEVGAYLRIKYVESKRISLTKKSLIRKAYVASNISIQEYVEFICSESTACGVEIGYVKKEKMKSFLEELL